MADTKNQAKVCSCTVKKTYLRHTVCWCTKNGAAKDFPVPTINKIEAIRLAELECQKWVPGRGGGGCFAGDTQVLIHDGTRRRIDQIKPGEEVAGGSYFSKGLGVSAVLNAYVTEHASYCILTLSNGESIVASQKQPVMTVSGPVQARRIVPGTSLLTVGIDKSAGESEFHISSVEARVGPITLYSLELSEADFYFVGESLLGGGCEEPPRHKD